MILEEKRSHPPPHDTTALNVPEPPHSRSNSGTPQSVGLLFTRDQSDNTHNSKTSMSPVGFEPANPTSEWPQTHDWDRADTGISVETEVLGVKKKLSYYHDFIIKVTWNVLGSSGRQLNCLNLDRVPHQLMYKEGHTSRSSVSPHTVWMLYSTLTVVPLSAVR